MKAISRDKWEGKFLVEKEEKGKQVKMKLKLITQLLVLLLVNGYNCFNLDVNNYIRHEGQDGSMFGFSVTLHQEQQRSWWVSRSSPPVSLCASRFLTAGQHMLVSELLLNSVLLIYFAVATPWDTFSSETPRCLSWTRKKSFSN